MPLEKPIGDDLEASTRRWSQAAVVLVFVFALAFPFYRAVEPGRRADAFREHQRELAAQGAELFATSCASCHGGEGRGGPAPALNARQFLTSATDDQIFALISSGIPGTSMPAYSIDLGGPMTSEQIEALTAYLRSLEDGAPDRPDWRSPLGPPEEDDDVGTTTTTSTEVPTDPEPQPLDGGALYINFCASCHGAELSGATAPPLGPDSRAAELSTVELTEKIRRGSRGMPGFGDSLNDEQIAAIVAFLEASS